MFWPVDSSREDHGVGNVVEAFRSLGYEECDDGAQEEGFEKLALYGSAMMYTHAARATDRRKLDQQAGTIGGHLRTQRPKRSKAVGDYGEVVQYMKRPL